ncbi:hypothetical protein V2G26_008629 [Clonostachys chloroleuca]
MCQAEGRQARQEQKRRRDRLAKTVWSILAAGGGWQSGVGRSSALKLKELPARSCRACWPPATCLSAATFLLLLQALRPGRRRDGAIAKTTTYGRLLYVGAVASIHAHRLL